MYDTKTQVFNYIDNHGKMITDDDLFIIQSELNIDYDEIKKSINLLLKNNELRKMFLDQYTGTTRSKQKTGYEVDAYVVNMDKYSQELSYLIGNICSKGVEQ